AKTPCADAVAPEGKEGTGASLPFALDALDIFGACTPVMWAVVSFSPGTGSAGDPVRKVDIDLCDETGQVRVRMQGFATRSAHRTQSSRVDMAAQGAFTLTPVWDAVALDQTQSAFPAASDRVLVVAPAGESVLSQSLRQRYPSAQTLRIEDSAGVDT